jgi:hypothetical protein
MGLDRIGSPPGRTVLPRSQGGGREAQPGRTAVLPGAGPPRAGGRSLAAGTSALIWAFHLVIYGGSVSPPCRRARGKVTAWLYFRRRGHRHGRAPWPGPHRGPVGRAAGPPARDVRAGPSAGGYGSAALFLISPFSSPRSATHPGGPMAGSPALVARLFWERYEGRPPWGVTQRWLPGGMSRCADRSPEGATAACRGRCAGLTCPRRAAAAPPDVSGSLATVRPLARAWTSTVSMGCCTTPGLASTRSARPAWPGS